MEGGGEWAECIIFDNTLLCYIISYHHIMLYYAIIYCFISYYTALVYIFIHFFISFYHFFISFYTFSHILVYSPIFCVFLYIFLDFCSNKTDGLMDGGRLRYPPLINYQFHITKSSKYIEKHVKDMQQICKNIKTYIKKGRPQA